MKWQKFLVSRPGLFLLMVTLASVGYLLADELRKRYGIEKEITQLEEQILSLQLESGRLSDLIKYFQTESFQEKEIRRKLNLQKPGEHVVALPAEGKSKEVFAQDRGGQEQETNWEKWWKYFFGVK